jgi:hypothetical protein
MLFGWNLYYSQLRDLYVKALDTNMTPHTFNIQKRWSERAQIDE